MHRLALGVHRCIHASHTGARDIDIHALKICELIELQLGIAVRGVCAVVFESVQILVALSADFTTIRLLFFHADCAWIRDGSQGIDY